MKKDQYQALLSDLPHLFDGATHYITCLANLSAELKTRFHSFSWVGFYLFDGEKLILGPFQGLPACETITLDRGVCGASASKLKTIIVNDVHEYINHIACDSGSRSEIVVPLLFNHRLIGVLDIDSYELANFDAVDQNELEEIVKFVGQTIKFPAAF